MTAPQPPLPRTDPTQTTLITGASSGLGAELARQLAARGHDLALCARRTELLTELANELSAMHPGIRVAVRAMDVTDEQQVVEGFQVLQTELGRIDRVVVNAGVAGGAALGTGGHEANRQTVMTNFVGALASADAAMRIFRAQQSGHLVFVASMAGLRGLPGSLAAYSATKAALVRLAEGLRMELYGSAIKVTVLYPGYVATELNPGARPGPMMSTVQAAGRAMVGAMEHERPSAFIPRWPWAVLAPVMRYAPLPLLRRMVGPRGAT